MSASDHSTFLESSDFIKQTIPAMFNAVAIGGGNEMHSIISKNNLLLRSVNTLSKVHVYNSGVVKTCKKLVRVLTDFQETINIFRELPGIGTQVASILAKDRIKYLIGIDDADMASSVLAGSEKDQRAKYTFSLTGAQLAKWQARTEHAKKAHSKAPKRQWEDRSKGGKEGHNNGKNFNKNKKAHFEDKSK